MAKEPSCIFLVSVFGSRPPYPHRLGCLVMREWHYLGGLGDVVFCVSMGMGFRSPNEAQGHSLFLLPENLDAELSVTSPAPWLPPYAMLPDMMTKD